MSYDISLTHSVTGEVIELDSPHQMKGGTFAVGGTTDASLNITWNYAKHYYNVLDEDLGIRVLYGKTGAQSIPILQKGIAALGDDVDENYWKDTEGNAKTALIQLIALAEMRPDGIWVGD